MSTNATNATTPTSSATKPTKSSTVTSGSKGADDTQSIASQTSTLYEAKDNKNTDTKKDTKKQGDTLGASSTSFAKKAKEQGWAAPTATRPSFGW